MAVMRSISLAKPLIIMMVGLPGAGKSFFARQFSDTFGAPLISYDKIHFEIFKQPQFDNEEHMTVQRLVGYQIEEFAKTKKTFIVDGGLYTRAERTAIRQYANKAGYGAMIIWVQTDLATCQQRALKRNPRKEDDKYNHSLTVEVFQLYARKLTPPTAQESYVVISGKHTYATQAKMVLRKLAAPREKQATVEPARARTITVNGNNDTPPTEPPQRRSVTIK